MKMTGMTEADIRAAFEAGNRALDKAEDGTLTKKRSKKLKWHERQYGAGWIHGFWVGIAAGVPLAVVLAIMSKVLIDWFMSY
jgi:hypothetical protein